jgi:hypothetical protein
MKRHAASLQLIASLACGLVWLRSAGIWSSSLSEWLASGTAASASLLVLALVYGTAVVALFVIPRRAFGQQEWFFASGFGVCLGLVLIAAVGGRVGTIQLIAAFALGTSAQFEQSRSTL